MWGKFKGIILYIIKYLFIFLLCGSIYCILEILFKGAERGTHWTMFLLAGISGVCFIDGLNNIFTYEMDFLLQIFICAICITLEEYIVGITFNCNYSIWDYRNMPLNLDGQICLPFFFIWCGISTISIPLLDFIEYKIFKYLPETPPYYKICGKIIYKMKNIRKDK